MKTLTLTNVPNSLLTRLEQVTSERKTSINTYCLAQLTKAVRVKRNKYGTVNGKGE